RSLRRDLATASRQPGERRALSNPGGQQAFHGAERGFHVYRARGLGRRRRARVPAALEVLSGAADAERSRPWSEMRTLACVLGIYLVLGALQSQVARADERERAEALNAEGRELVKQLDLTGAAQRFRQALQL